MNVTSPTVLCACPCCGASLRVEAVAPGTSDADAWRELRHVAELTGQPVSRLRRLVKAGELPARQGARGAYLVRRSDVEALLASLPPVPPRRAEADADDDEIARFRRMTGS